MVPSEEKWLYEYGNALFRKEFDIKDIVNIITPNFPDELFKYGFFDNERKWENIIYKGIFKISSPFYFNDPFDCELSLTSKIMNIDGAKEYVIKYLRERLKIKQYDINRIKYSMNLKKDIDIVFSHYGLNLDIPKYEKGLNEALQQSNEKFKKSLGITCFSEDNKSILMWSHYAHYHSGYCIMFKFPEKSSIRESIYPVAYRNERLDFGSQIFGNEKYWIFKAVLLKSWQWDYEKEWRFLSIKIDDDLINNEMIPEIDLSSYIKGIYLGAKIDNQIEAEICSYGKIKNLPIYKMQLSDRTYELFSTQIV